eukprot:5285311-Pleurochrysis_carterae.AAC.1
MHGGHKRLPPTERHSCWGLTGLCMQTAVRAHKTPEMKEEADRAKRRAKARRRALSLSADLKTYAHSRTIETYVRSFISRSRLKKLKMQRFINTKRFTNDDGG